MRFPESTWPQPPRPMAARNGTQGMCARSWTRASALRLRRAWHPSTFPWVLILLLGSSIGSGAGEKNTVKDAETGTKQAFAESQITSDRMEMDFTAHVAKFDGHAVVKDHQMTLKTDSLIAFFTADNKLTKVEALGNVKILQPQADRRAEAGHATYDVKKGTIVLTEAPRLITGDNVLSGASQITYFRDSERVVCEGGHPELSIAPKKSPGSKKLPGFLDKLGKARGKKGKARK